MAAPSFASHQLGPAVLAEPPGRADVSGEVIGRERNLSFDKEGGKTCFQEVELLANHSDKERH